MYIYVYTTTIVVRSKNKKEKDNLLSQILQEIQPLHKRNCCWLFLAAICQHFCEHFLRLCS